MTAAANTTTAIAAAIRPHGLRCWVTTCVGGRVRPFAPFLPVGRAVAVPDREPELPPDERPDPPRGSPRELRLSSGLRSLAKATPRCWARVGAGEGGHAPFAPRASLGRRAVRVADPRAGPRSPSTGATGGRERLS